MKKQKSQQKGLFKMEIQSLGQQVSQEHPVSHPDPLIGVRKINH